jgi:hypothetical protein
VDCLIKLHIVTDPSTARIRHFGKLVQNQREKNQIYLKYVLKITTGHLLHIRDITMETTYSATAKGGNLAKST